MIKFCSPLNYNEENDRKYLKLNCVEIIKTLFVIRISLLNHTKFPSNIMLFTMIIKLAVLSTLKN